MLFPYFCIDVWLDPCSTLQAGSDLLHAGAFVHHYSEFGIGTEELRLALEQVEEIVDAYAALQPA